MQRVAFQRRRLILGTFSWRDPVPLIATADAHYLHFVGEINRQLEFAQFELRRVKYLVGAGGSGLPCGRVGQVLELS